MKGAKVATGKQPTGKKAAAPKGHKSGMLVGKGAKFGGAKVNTGKHC